MCSSPSSSHDPIIAEPSSRNSSGGSAIPDDVFSNITPRRGRLIPLCTKEEAEHTLQLVPAYVIEIPQRLANMVLKCVVFNFSYHLKHAKESRMENAYIGPSLLNDQ